MKSFLSLLVAVAAMLPSSTLAKKVNHFLFQKPIQPPMKLAQTNIASDAIQQETFDQLIDHGDPSKGTFQQRYWVNSQWYKPGNPIIVNTPGEAAADGYTGYLGNQTLSGWLAQQLGGLAVLVEHRYWGTSHPFDDLSLDNLQYLTLNNSVTDFAHFAQTIKFPDSVGLNGTDTSPTKTPWIFVGGSYAGSLASYLKAQFGDSAYWITYSTSAPVEAVWDYGAYWVPIQDGLPANCSADAAAVISHVDDVLKNGSDGDIKDLKTIFGLQNVSHNDDFASALTSLPGQWQGQQADTGYNIVNQWCDALEVQNGTAAPETGYGLDVALPAWGKFFSDNYVKFCGTEDADACFTTYDANSSFYTDTSFDNDYRQWNYLTCTTFGYWQTGGNVSKIVSELVDVEYFTRQCDLMFPGYKATPGPDYVNTAYGGWDLQSDKIWSTNAQLDPWREASRSSDFGPELASTDAQPIGVIKDGIHCWDLLVSNWIDGNIPPIVNSALSKIQDWLGEFNTTNSNGLTQERTLFGRWL